MRTLILFSALEKQYLIFLEKKTLTHKRRQAADIVKMILDFQMRQLHLLQVEQTANHLAINFLSPEGTTKRLWSKWLNDVISGRYDVIFGKSH